MSGVKSVTIRSTSIHDVLDEDDERRFLILLSLESNVDKNDLL